MKALYFVPFSYFVFTRLRGGKVAFHVFFEWLAAVVVVVFVGSSPPLNALFLCLTSYIAFICLYEIGYLVNDLFSSKKEEGGRQRGPQGDGLLWIAGWIVTRLGIFAGISYFTEKLTSVEWWSFFAALSIVFALHNILTNQELKVATFLWLSWFRFMAPVIFVIRDNQRLGVALAAAMVYVIFRLFGYLDSKGLLKMPGRQRAEFRLVIFLVPLAGVLALWPYEHAFGFVVLCSYFTLVAIIGTVLSKN